MLLHDPGGAWTLVSEELQADPTWLPFFPKELPVLRQADSAHNDPCPKPAFAAAVIHFWLIALGHPTVSGI